MLVQMNNRSNIPHVMVLRMIVSHTTYDGSEYDGPTYCI